MRHKVSAIIICMNEEARIRRCLESVHWADEIVVVDSGSTDRTVEIVSEYTSNIFENSDWKGFGPQKKLAESKASNDWVFSIDADEVVDDELRQEMERVLKTANEKSVYRVNRLTNFCNKLIWHSGWYPDRIVRLYNKKHFHFNDAYVHESVDCEGATINDLKGHLLHYTFQSLESYIDKRNGYAKAWAKARVNKRDKVSVAEIILRTIAAFIRHYLIKRGFLDGYHGFLIAVIQMQYTFNKYNFLRFALDERKTVDETPST